MRRNYQKITLYFYKISKQFDTYTFDLMLALVKYTFLLFILVSCTKPEDIIVSTSNELNTVLSKTELKLDHEQIYFFKNIIKDENDYLINKYFTINELLDLYRSTKDKIQIYEDYISLVDLKLINNYKDKEYNWLLDDHELSLKLINHSDKSVNAYRLHLFFYNVFEEQIHSQKLDVENRTNPGDSTLHTFNLTAVSDNALKIIKSPNIKYYISLESIAFDDTVLHMENFRLLNYLKD